MDRGMVLFVGALITFSSSWLGLVLFPFWQLNNEQPFPNQSRESDRSFIQSVSVNEADLYPRSLSGNSLSGMRIYQANGCMYCHTQQIRSEAYGNWWEDGQMKTGSDIKRGWGLRRTVSRDYIFDSPTMLGTMRTGPDVAAIGPRYSEQWQHIHLYNPRAVNSWSTMPSFAWMYRRQPIVGERIVGNQFPHLGREWTVNPGYRWRPTSAEWNVVLIESGDSIRAEYRASKGTLHLSAASSVESEEQLLTFWLTRPESGFQIVPTSDAEALIAYLLNLNKTEVKLPEAKE